MDSAVASITLHAWKVGVKLFASRLKICDQSEPLLWGVIDLMGVYGQFFSPIWIDHYVALRSLRMNWYIHSTVHEYASVLLCTDC